MSLYNELKRRNVFRVAIAYLAGAWLLIEVSGTLFPVFGVPDWGIRFVLIVLALGFAPALIISWAYELTPEGLKREKDVVRDVSITHVTARRLDGITIGLIIVALAFILADRLWLSPGTKEQSMAPIEVVTDDMQTSEPDPQYPPNSIAVLPFVNMSDDAANEYFSDGISEELLNLLAKIPELRVISRSSAFAFKGEKVDIPTVAKKLNVAHVLEGSVRKVGNRVRITAQLIDTRSDTHMWSETYDRELNDIFAIQDEISGQIVQALKITMGGGEQEAMTNAQKPTENLEAYEYYLRGRYFWQRRGEDNIRRAIDLFEQATELDPQFARAWSSLAAVYHTLPGYSDAPKGEYDPMAVSAARKALTLDDSMAEAYAVLGDIARTSRKWSEAEALYLKAIDSEPKDTTAHLWYGEHLVSVGLIRNALEETLIAYQLDPLHPGTNANLAGIYFHLNDTRNALKYGAAAWDLGHYAGLYRLAWTNLHLGEFDRAIEFAGQFDEKYQQTAKLQNPPILKLVIEAHIDTVKRTLLLETFAESEMISFNKYLQLLAYANFGMIDDAYRVTNMIRDLDAFAWWLFGRPDMASFRQDPRFADLVTELGLVDYWREYGWPDACQPVGDSVICE
jgi:TolB-like protein/Flp pilus assembly protein TadD